MKALHILALECWCNPHKKQLISMEKTCTCEANGRTTSQEFCRLLWNTRVNFRVDM